MATMDPGSSAEDTVFHVSRIDNLLVYTAFQRWNEGDGIRFSRHFIATVPTLGHPWGVLFDLRRFDLTGSGFLLLYREMDRWRAPNGPGSHAFLFAANQHVPEVIMNGLQARKGRRWAIFNDRDLCLEWLGRQDGMRDKDLDTIIP